MGLGQIKIQGMSVPEIEHFNFCLIKHTFLRQIISYWSSKVAKNQVWTGQDPEIFDLNPQL